jgi:hypothetical protein
MLKQSPDKDFNYFSDTKSLNGIQNQMYLEKHLKVSWKPWMNNSSIVTYKKGFHHWKPFFSFIKQWIIYSLK